jgi:AbrB family looped-hinge helix DNA binding protein
MDDDIVRIGVRGRITIPKHIREKAGMRYQDAYRVHLVGGVVILEHLGNKKDTKGMLPLDTFISK